MTIRWTKRIRPGWVAIASLALAACAAPGTPAPLASSAEVAPPTSPPARVESHAVPSEAAPAPASTAAPGRTVARLLETDSRFSRFTAALRAAGLWSLVADPDRRLTVFAPTDAAFERLSAAQQLALDHPEQGRDVLLFHLVSGEFPEEALIRLDSVETELGERVAVVGDLYETPLVGGAPVIGAGARTSHGVVYALDGVLWPLAGRPLAEIVRLDPRLSEFASAVRAAGLTELLMEAGPYTLFAPTDEAFAGLSPEHAGLLREPDTLRQILLYHVVPGLVTSETALDLTWSDTLLEQPVICDVQGNLWTINDAEVLVTDIRAANGLLHLVSEVLVPPIDLGQ
jgi:transforming growth factor-beta-induced protein